MRYLALLRGINVGGNNIVRMPELRACFECLGLKNVTSYIQSGNLLFDSPLQSTSTLSTEIEQALSAESLKTSQVVVISKSHLTSIVTKAPPAFGTEPARFRYDVVFIKAPLRAPELLPAIGLRAGVDEAWEANRVLYFKRLISKASQSYLFKLTQTTAYKSMTIRNWTTTTKLFELMSRRHEETHPR